MATLRTADSYPLSNLARNRSRSARDLTLDVNDHQPSSSSSNNNNNAQDLYSPTKSSRRGSGFSSIFNNGLGKKSRGSDDYDQDDEQGLFLAAAATGDGRTRSSNRDDDENDIEQERLLREDAGMDGSWPETRHSRNHAPSRTNFWTWVFRSQTSDSTSSKSRTINFGPEVPSSNKFPPNITRNQKYSILTFLPLVFYEQFKFFFNLYFLLVALSQFIPALKIGYLATYIAPLAFVLAVTMGKEAVDDYHRYQRDKEANSFRYLILDNNQSSTNIEQGSFGGLLTRSVPSSKLRVGDMVMLEKNMRVPADMVLLRTAEGPAGGTAEAAASDSKEETETAEGGKTLADSDLQDETEKMDQDSAEGACFVRTDQLDGETDWKLKLAAGPVTQAMSDAQLVRMKGSLYADPPIKDIHSFVGNITIRTVTQDDAEAKVVAPLSADNVLWANTVLAAGSAVGMVVYTGRETRASMNTTDPESKVGLLDIEINKMAKILCAVTFLLSLLLVALNGFRSGWYIYVFRFLILFSTIIPISLRVNLDMGKTVYAHQIQNDPEIPGAIVRTSTLPEELGRIEYLLSDKTGTLTQNGELPVLPMLLYRS